MQALATRKEYSQFWSLVKCLLYNKRRINTLVNAICLDSSKSSFMKEDSFKKSSNDKASVLKVLSRLLLLQEEEQRNWTAEEEKLHPEKDVSF